MLFSATEQTQGLPDQRYLSQYITQSSAKHNGPQSSKEKLMGMIRASRLAFPLDLGSCVVDLGSAYYLLGTLGHPR